MTALETPLNIISTDSRITHSVVMVDSPTAGNWLAKNVGNRPVRQIVVERYRSDMAAGRWTFAGDPIRFDTGGRLLDGQHRLAALVELPGMAIPMLVVRGLPNESQGVMDQGAKRTPGDQLALRGVKNSHNVAAAVKQVIIWESGLLFRDNKVGNAITASRIEQWVSDNHADIDYLNSINHTVRQNDAPPSVAGAAAIMFSRLDPEGCTTFFTLLARGAGVEGNPIVTLDKRLQRIRREGLKTSNRDYLALLILAWNAWRDGKITSKFQRPSGGSWSEANFPEPR